MPCWRETMERPWNIVGMEADFLPRFPDLIGQCVATRTARKGRQSNEAMPWSCPREDSDAHHWDGEWDMESQLYTIATVQVDCKDCIAGLEEMYGGRCMRHQSPFC
jgi:hypothetical protein